MLAGHLIFAGLLCLTCFSAFAQQGKLLATPVATQFEGTGGGGLVPFATLSGYASREEISINSFVTHLAVNDFSLNAYGASVNWFDRLEVSVTDQKLGVEPLQTDIRQRVYGVKTRLYGDIVYSYWPQISVGAQFKRLKDTDVASAAGADKTRGTDYYLAMTRLHLGALQGYNLLWNLTLRSTAAHQTGFLGFHNSRQLQLEGSAAVLLGRHVAVGVEYRSKPDQLTFAQEDDWSDVFVAWFPNKRINLTVAYADLGAVAGQRNQRGLYLSTTFYLH